ncbi:FAD binding domain-containing protein [Apiospora aurea]|uniref:FAD binding domain-containing protein n=1 Tax=Apiospora aurea TaxID=335848 RepID=A0ABR1Q568_9PEZI
MHSLVFVFGGLLSIAQAATNTSWANAIECLRKKEVPIDEHGSVDWIRDSAAYNVRLPIFTPAAIAVPTTIAQIQKAVICGNQTRFKVSAKAGGHSYTGGGFGSENGHLIVQLDRMYNVTLNRMSNIATVQPGARLGHMATELFNLGNRSISHGTCPRKVECVLAWVGASGHMTSGGYGMSSHTRGLALDWVESATVVLANGDIVEASETENLDLFWAIRGAGPNFGIVASWRLRTFEAPVNLTWFRIALDWNQGTAARYLGDVETYIHTEMPAELNFRIADYDKGHPIAEGLYYGTATQFNSTSQPFLKASNGNLTKYRQVDWIDAMKHYSVDNTFNTTDVVIDYVEPGPPDNFFAKSLTFNGLKGDAAKAFVDYWYGAAMQVDRRWFFQIDAAGGANSAYSKPPFDSRASSSYAHRDKTFIIQFYDAVPTSHSNETYQANGLSFLNGWVDNVTAALDRADNTNWGAYANYPDPTLGRGEAQKWYYGASLEQLRKYKLKYDPEELFKFPQSIQPWGQQQLSDALRRH